MVSVTKSVDIDFDDRPQAGHGSADGGADDGGFGNRRIAHPLPAELFQKPAVTLNGPPACADVLAGATPSNKNPASSHR